MIRMVLYTQIKGKPDRRKHKTCQTDGHKKYNNYPQKEIKKGKDHDNKNTERSKEFQRSDHKMQNACFPGLFRWDTVQYEVCGPEQGRHGQMDQRFQQ